jgi:uncharacterized membrane protein
MYVLAVAAALLAVIFPGSSSLVIIVLPLMVPCPQAIIHGLFSGYIQNVLSDAGVRPVSVFFPNSVDG